MRILVINPWVSDVTINRDMAGGLGFSAGNDIVLPPMDLVNAATTLINLKHEVTFIDALAERIENFDYIKDVILTKKIEVVIGGLSLPTIDEDCTFYRKVKSIDQNIQVIIKTGINYKEILFRILKKSKANLIVFGETDLNIEDYILGKRYTASATIKKKVLKYYPLTAGDRVINLDELPISDRSLLNNQRYSYLLIPGKVTTMQTTRGCPYPCSFYCPYPLVQGKVWRSMSVNRVIKELKYIVSLGIKNVLFRDATFTLDNQRTKDICNLIIKNKIKLNWWCETRINVLSEDLLVIMSKAGCKGINVGVETLDQELIFNQGKPGVSLESVINIRNIAKKLKIKLLFLMIIGLPDDNLKTINNTYDYLTKLKPESVGFSIITPYPGTPMFDKAISEKLVENFDWNRFNGSTANMRTRYLKPWELTFVRKILMWGAMSTTVKGLVGVLMIELGRFVLRLWKRIRRE